MTRQDESGPAGGGNVSRRTLVGAMAAGAFAGSRGAVAQAERGARAGECRYQPAARLRPQCTAKRLWP